ncbi:FtsX-like permease family protein [Actinomadura sp. 7K534]|uniref:FtsX-like permease family protein n=1 Tax=Actinomadura sp. 7K534 TaxID=2530366 RepID=UPI001051245E|nr:FtsX-like permease family protein [Actinomadura sp. 7K534]TDB90426.1 FtsX-like permease family protein [Actinomadura sp. 7K534]
MTGGRTRDLFAVAAMLARGTSRGERRRRRLLVSGAALATFFLLGAANLLLIRGTTQTEWAGLVAEEGLRPGTALALALLVVPVLALLHQVGRVAQAAQERRLAALRLAGATPRDVRLLGVAEALRVGTVGALIGTVGYVAGQQAAMAALGVGDTARYAIPPWPVPAVMALVVAAAALVSLRVSRHVVVSPLSVARRASRPAPSPYTILPLALGLPIVVAGAFIDAAWNLWLIALGAVLAVAGIAAGAARVILESARLAGRWARTPETLLAARTLEADPRAGGRTMAVVALVVFFGTATGVVTWDVVQTGGLFDDPEDRFWLVSLGLTYGALLFALLVAVTALVVHRAEALLEGGRSMAALAAAGAPVASLRRSTLRQTLIAATPVCAIGALTALLGMAPGLFLTPDLPMVAWTAGHALFMVALAVAAAAAVTALSNRLLTRAAAPANLRAE